MNAGFAAAAVVVALFASVFVLGPLMTTPISVPVPTVTATVPGAQLVSVRALSTGFYDRQELTVQAGKPVEFHFSADLDSGCGRQLVIPDFGVQLISNGDEKVAVFTPEKPGSYPYRCGMNMFRGVLKVL